MNRRGLRYERDESRTLDHLLDRTTIGFRHEVLDAQRLRRQDAVECGQAQVSLSMNEVGKVGSAEAGLPCKERSAELTTLDTAGHLDAKPLVELRKGHLWNFVFKLYTSTNQFADCKAIREPLPDFEV